jgi:hypothetical protein
LQAALVPDYRAVQAVYGVQQCMRRARLLVWKADMLNIFLSLGTGNITSSASTGVAWKYWNA